MQARRCKSNNLLSSLFFTVLTLIASLADKKDGYFLTHVSFSILVSKDLLSERDDFTPSVFILKYGLTLFICTLTIYIIKH